MNLAELQLPEQIHAHQHADGAALAAAMARQVADALRAALAERGRALLVVSGGRSPALFFEHLSRQVLAWDKVQVSLADERWVPPDSPDSNEALVRRHLLQNQAAGACLVGLYHPAADLDEAARLAEQALGGLPPIDVLVLGMGDDGHTASLFPDSPRLAEALSAGCRHAVLPMRAPSSPRQRLTQTLPRLASARLTLLAIEGGSKLSTLGRALQPGEVAQMPIRAFLRAPLELHWNP